MFFKRERAKNTTKAALVAGRRNRSMADLLTYLIQLDASTILHKDGALSRHFHYVAMDTASSTDEELDFHADTADRVLRMLDNGWMIETNLISQPLKTNESTQEFPDVVSALIDDERRLQFDDANYFTSTYYLSITWRPENRLENKLRTFAIDEPTRVDGFHELLQQFNQQVAEITGLLGRSLRHITPLSGDELTTYLYRCITASEQALNQPPVGYFLDSYVAEELVGGFLPKVANRHVRVLAIDELPLRTHPAMLEVLSQLPLTYRWSSRFIGLSPITANSYLNRYRKSWSSKALGFLGVIRESFGMPAKIDWDAQNTANALEVAQVENRSGLTGHGFYNSNLILMHDDKAVLDKAVEDITTLIQRLNFRARDERVNAVDAYLGSIPCHGDYNLRKMLQETGVVAQLLPLATIYQGERTSPCPKKGYVGERALVLVATEGDRPVYLNLHYTDIGHTLILGPTGTGKTTLLALLMASHRRYRGSRIIVMDKDFSNRATLLSLGGRYMDLRHDGFQFGALARVSADAPDAIETAIDWLSGICTLQGVTMNAERQNLLREGVLRLSKHDACHKNLSHLVVQDPAMREALDAFSRSQYAKLVNGTSVGLGDFDVLGVDVTPLVRDDDGGNQSPDFGLAILQAMFNELDTLFLDERPTLIILEEAWKYTRHPLFLAKLSDWFKTLRKRNVAMIYTSQDFDDIVKSAAFETIRGSCPTRIFLPNRSARLEVYEKLDCNAPQVDIIKNMQYKRDYYLQSPYGNRQFRLDLGELAQAFFCVTEESDRQTFDTLYQPDNQRWTMDWLRYKGLNHWAAFAETHYFGEQQDVA